MPQQYKPKEMDGYINITLSRFQIKNTNKDKEGHCTMINWYILQEDIKIVPFFLQLIKVLNYMK